ncbi:Ankyrin repeat protein 1 [Giardia muris]|uniref:Ankyrin repeat protein 1 n=1 Tax=Giardia muris TaxID=5742 RepID=A0A4Z1T4Y6_GIAMU|nr:Ankyrin repeat protein 1 [Giardia muris]|eukprot:TNJ27511.1 Ankyrin repeat protein 1 [Giardia muris]
MLEKMAHLLPTEWQRGYSETFHDVCESLKGGDLEKASNHLLQVQDAMISHLHACREQISTPEERFFRAYSEIYYGCNEVENREACAAVDPQTLAYLSLALKKPSILHWLASQPSTPSLSKPDDPSEITPPSPLMLPRRLGLTPLLRAATTEGQRQLKPELLLAAGAIHGDPELTSLMYAAHRGDTEFLRFVLGLEVRIATKEGWTALMYAAYGGQPEAVEVLLPYEAGMVATEGWTALLLAAHYGHADCARLLAPHEFHLQLPGNVTAIDVSNARGHQDCADAIQKALNTQN